MGGNFWKFPLIVNITDRLGTTVDLGENLQQYIRLLTLHYYSTQVLDDVNECTVIWKVSGMKFPEKSFWKFPEIEGIIFRKFF